jgi:hypothetical protein
MERRIPVVKRVIVEVFIGFSPFVNREFGG